QNIGAHGNSGCAAARYAQPPGTAMVADMATNGSDRRELRITPPRLRHLLRCAGDGRNAVGPLHVGARPHDAMAAAVVRHRDLADTAGMGGNLRQVTGLARSLLARGERAMSLALEILPPAIPAQDHNEERCRH